jgi:methyl-accepting chemotaxis protein
VQTPAVIAVGVSFDRIPFYGVRWETMRITIRGKIIGLTVLALLLIAVFAAIALWQQREMFLLIGRLVQANAVLSNHQTMDMMHDAIRGDVFRLQLSDTPEKLKEADDELHDHVGVFTEKMKLNQSIASEAEITAALTEAAPLALAYVAAAEHVFKIASTDRAAAIAELPEFQKAFSLAEDKLGAVTEHTLGVIGNLGEQRQVAQAQGQWLIAGAGFGSAVILLLASLVLSSRIAVPIREMRSALERMAGGDWTVGANVKTSDEIGDMAEALERMRQTVRGLIGSVTTRADSLTTASGGLADTSNGLTRDAETTAGQATTVSTSAEQVSTSIATVASATTELSHSISEISSQTGDAARVAGEAVRVAGEVSSAITRLGASSQEIGDVVKTITAIAEQTNLLALNATIEAAGAGEAGRGFAVVAGEVKTLARQTAEATEDISKRVTAIQSDAASSVAAIAKISIIIEKIDQATQTITSAVEQQSATTGEISRTVQEAARGGVEIATAVNTVAAAADAATGGARQVGVAARELASLAQSMREQVASLKC